MRSPIPTAKFIPAIVALSLISFFSTELEAGQLRVATFNVKEGLGAPATSSHEGVARILERIGADVVGFQELQGDAANLDALGNRLGLPHDLALTFGSMQVGLLSRYPVTGHWIFQTGMTRRVLLARIDVPGALRKPWVAVVHLKCCGNTGGDEQYVRAVELTRLRQVLPEFTTPQDPILIMGDFNLVARDNFTYASGRFTGIEYPLTAWADADGYFVPEGIFKLDARHAGSGRESWTWRGSSQFPPGALDHIMANAVVRAGGVAVEILDAAKDAVGVGGLAKFGSPLTADLVGASDHLPIFADLQLADAPLPQFRVLASGDFLPVGTTAGEFDVVQNVYTIANDKTSSLDWFVTESAAWLDVTVTQGVTDVSGQTSVTASLNAQALALPPGDYSTQILFTDRQTGSVISRPVSLRIMSSMLQVNAPSATNTFSGAIAYQGTMTRVLSNGLSWSNRANGMTGTVPYSARWSASVPLAEGTNIVDFRAGYAVTNVSTRASDGPADPAYASGWSDNANGGQGFGPWTLRNDWGFAGQILFGPGVFNMPTNFRGAFSLWASGDGVTTAQRSFERPLSTNDTFRLQFDNNWINWGKSVGFALADASGNKRLDFFFVGGESHYRVADANGVRVTPIGYTDQGQEISVQLTASNGYRLVAGTNTITGTLGSGSAISQLVASNNGSGYGTEFDLYLGDMGIEDSFGFWAYDSPEDMSYGGVWTNGSQGGVGFGPWQITSSASGGWAGHARFDTNVWNVTPAFGGAFVLWASGGGYSEARRSFPQVLTNGETFILEFDNNQIEPGKLVGFSLADATGTDLVQFLSYGGESLYWVQDAGEARPTTIPVTENGLVVRVELTGTNSYRLSSGTNTITGDLAAGGSISQLRGFNYGSGPGTPYDFYLGSMRIESRVVASQQFVATAQEVVRQREQPPTTDGLPDSWWVQYFGTLDGVSASVDSDQDGFSNSQEHALGTHPLDRASALRVHAPEMLTGQISIRWDGVAGKSYRIMATTNLSSGPWMQHGETVTAETTGIQTRMLQTSELQQFFRIELSSP